MYLRDRKRGDSSRSVSVLFAAQFFRPYGEIALPPHTPKSIDPPPPDCYIRFIGDCSRLPHDGL